MKTTQIEMSMHQLKTILLILGATAQAAEMVRYRAKPLGSKVVIAGTANIHDWTMDGELVNGFMEVPADVQFDQSKTTLPGVKDQKVDARVEVSIPVTSMNGSWSGMNEPY